MICYLGQTVFFVLTFITTNEVSASYPLSLCDIQVRQILWCQDSPKLKHGCEYPKLQLISGEFASCWKNISSVHECVHFDVQMLIANLLSSYFAEWKTQLQFSVMWKTLYDVCMASGGHLIHILELCFDLLFLLRA